MIITFVSMITILITIVNVILLPFSSIFHPFFFRLIHPPFRTKKRQIKEPSLTCRSIILLLQLQLKLHLKQHLNLILLKLDIPHRNDILRR